MLTEQKLLKSVEILPTANAIQVLWENRILRDDSIIATENFRRAYCSNEKVAFIQDLGDEADKYLALIEWDVEVPDETPELITEG